MTSARCHSSCNDRKYDACQVLLINSCSRNVVDYCSLDVIISNTLLCIWHREHSDVVVAINVQKWLIIWRESYSRHQGSLRRTKIGVTRGLVARIKRNYEGNVMYHHLRVVFPIIEAMQIQRNSDETSLRIKTHVMNRQPPVGACL